MLLVTSACESPDSAKNPSRQFSRTTARLTQEQEDVLGGESATDHWSSPSGNVSSSSIANGGESALALEPDGYTEVTSVALASLGEIGEQLGYDVRLPHTVSWGDVRVVLQVPSQQLWWYEVGAVALSQLSAGEYHAVSFPLDSNAIAALEGTYDDLVIRIIVNTETLAGPLLIDNLSFAAVTQVTASRTVEVDLPFVQGASVHNVVFATQDTLRLADGVRLVDTSGSSAAVVNSGTARTEIGSGAQTGTIWSKASTWLRSGSSVFGDVHSGSAIDEQNDVSVAGTRFPNEELGEPAHYRFSVTIPPEVGEIILAPDASADIGPGSYNKIKVDSRSVLHLESGTYFVKDLQAEPTGTIQLDTTSGPIVIWVSAALNLKGNFDFHGPADAFLVGYLGTAPITFESPLSGTVLAPFSKLRLAPLNGAEHRGSFFAKSIDAAEANTTIQHLAFGYWNQVLQVEPLATCTRSFADGKAAVLFGYDNRSELPVAIPVGPPNVLTPPIDVVLPEVFESGVHPRQFWVPIDESVGAVWQLGSMAAAYSSTLPACGPLDVPEEPSIPSPPASALLKAETASGIPRSVWASGATTLLPLGRNLPAPVYGGALIRSPVTTAVEPSPPESEFGTVTQALNGVTRMLTMNITHLDFDLQEGLCGTVDEYVKISINGGPFQKGRSVSVDVGDAHSADVEIRVYDDDDFLCGGDDLIYDSGAFFVSTTSAESRCEASGQLCWETIPASPPRVCYGLGATYVDAGQWPGTALTDDFAAQAGRQELAASFARAELTIEAAGVQRYHWSGVLDQGGCIPDAEAPLGRDWAASGDLMVTRKLLSQICLDPNSGACAGGLGLNVSVKGDGATGPTEFCILSSQTGATLPNCESAPVFWTHFPGEELAFVPAGESDVTRATAVIATMFGRDAETGGALGVAPFAQRLNSSTPPTGREITVQAGVFCPFCDDGSIATGTPLTCNSGLLAQMTSCQSDTTLQLQPDELMPGTTGPAASRLKNVVAHEFAHFIQRGVSGIPKASYGAGPGFAGVPLKCRCDHVDVNDQSHCLQSLELSGAGQTEGFAHFVSTLAWNKSLDGDCTFVYYKPFFDDQCVPGGTNCSDLSGGKVTPPPYPINCATPVKWRNNTCGITSSLDKERSGTEFDWMNFFRALTENPDINARWTATEILGAYKTACDGATTSPPTPPSPVTSGPSCDGTEVNWAFINPKAAKAAALLDGVDLLGLGEKGQAFLAAGDTYGVSNK